MQIAISDLAVNYLTTNQNVLRSKIERSNGSRDEREIYIIFDSVAFWAVLQFCIFYSFWCERTVMRCCFWDVSLSYAPSSLNPTLTYRDPVWTVWTEPVERRPQAQRLGWGLRWETLLWSSTIRRNMWCVTADLHSSASGPDRRRGRVSRRFQWVIRETFL